MLESQLQLCDELLSLHHPLAAKMLAVKVRIVKWGRLGALVEGERRPQLITCM
jgi:hypothetical protein